MRNRRQYSDADKASALATLDGVNGNLSEASRSLGIPLTTLAGWAKERGTHPCVTELRNEKKGDLADALESVAWKLVTAMEGKIGGASLGQIVMALGISVDKMRLLREQATAITKDDSLSESERSTRVTALLDAARTRRTGLAADGAAVN